MKKMLLGGWVLIGLALLVGPARAHLITVDGNDGDWTGVPPGVDSFAYSTFEGIWTDAVGDDQGDCGDAPGASDAPTPYAYPTDTLFHGTEADIKEWRVTADSVNNSLYFLIRIDYQTWWMPYVGICVDLDHLSGSGQGDVGGYRGRSLLDPHNEWEYLIQIRENAVWVLDTAWTDVSGAHQWNFSADDSLIEVGVDVAGWPISPWDSDTLYFTVYVGLNDFGDLREVDSVASQWQGGGGLGTNAGPPHTDPCIYDLCFVDSASQCTELNGYTDNTWTTFSLDVCEPVMLDSIVGIFGHPDIVLIGNVPDENQPPPSGDSNWCAPTSAVNIIDYWDNVRQHINATGAMDNWTRGQASDHIGWFMDTNNNGCPRRGNGSDGHKGTYSADEKPGIMEFLLWDTTWTFGHGKPDTTKKSRCWEVKTDYIAGWGLYTAEIDAGRPVKMDFMYWNPVPAGITHIDTASGEAIDVYSWGAVTAYSSDPDVWEEWDFVYEIGHAVTGVGYVQNWDPDDGGPLASDDYVIVHDNWPSTARNVAIPWRNWKVSVTVNPNEPLRFGYVSPGFGHMSGSPGDTLWIPWDVFNIGSEYDEYELLSVDSEGWEQLPDPPQAPLLGCHGLRVRSMAVIPDQAEPGTVNEITLIAASIIEPLVRDSASVTVTVASHLELSPSDDSYVDDADADGNHGWREYMLVGEWDGTSPYRTCRTYLKFDLSSIASGQEISSAKLFLNCRNLHDPPVEVGAHYLENDVWEEMTITWNNAPTGFNSTASDQTNLVDGFNSWTVTDDVQAAYVSDGLYSVVLRVPNEGGDATGGWFDTKEHPDPATRPYLEVQHAQVDVPHDVHESVLPGKFSLCQNCPNPFNPITEIAYALPENCHVTLEVYNLLGQRVATIVDEHQKAGYTSVDWDAGSLPTGVYFYTITAGDFLKTRKMILLK